MKFKVTVLETVYVHKTYLIEAKDKEQAKSNYSMGTVIKKEEVDVLNEEVHLVTEVKEP